MRCQLQARSLQKIFFIGLDTYIASGITIPAKPHRKFYGRHLPTRWNSIIWCFIQWILLWLLKGWKKYMSRKPNTDFCSGIPSLNGVETKSSVCPHIRVWPKLPHSYVLSPRILCVLLEILKKNTLRTVESADRNSFLYNRHMSRSGKLKPADEMTRNMQACKLLSPGLT